MLYEHDNNKETPQNDNHYYCYDHHQNNNSSYKFDNNDNKHCVTRGSKKSIEYGECNHRKIYIF